VKGLADDPNFYSWSLSYGTGTNPTSWNYLTSSSQPALLDAFNQPPTLANWNTQDRSNGIYTLRLFIQDEADNERSITIPIELYNVTIMNFSDTPDPFSPNGDGIKDTNIVTAQFNGTVNWTVAFKDSSSQTVRTLSGNGSSMSASWDGRGESNTPVPEGTYSWFVNCSDNYSNFNVSEFRVINIDLSGPNITLNLPVNELNTSVDSINFSWKMYDNFDSNISCNLSVNGIVLGINLTNSTGNLTNYTIYNLTEGYNFWNVTCIDFVNNTNTSVMYNFTVIKLP